MEKTQNNQPQPIGKLLKSSSELIEQNINNDNQNNESLAIYSNELARREGIEVYKVKFVGKLTTKNTFVQFKRLQLAFPNLSKDFFDLLKERLVENNFTDEILKKAIDNVIDTCQYLTPMIASIINYMSTIKTLDYVEYIRECSAGNGSYYSAIDVGNVKPRWALKTNVEKYKLKVWDKVGFSKKL